MGRGARELSRETALHPTVPDGPPVFGQVRQAVDISLFRPVCEAFHGLDIG